MKDLDAEQIKALGKLISQEGGVIWMRVGEGKTRPALLAAHKLIQESGHTVMLIVARRAAFYDWKQEVATLQLEYKIRELEDCPLNGVYFEPTIILVSDGKIFHDLTQDMIRSLWLNKQIGCIIADELWLYKNPAAQKHKALRRWTELTPAIGLSGSIMTARDIVDIYGQMTAIGRGRTLARTLTHFRQEYQIGVKDPIGNFPTWSPKPGAYQKIMDKIAPFTHIYMPDVSRVKTKVILTKVPLLKEQQDYITELKETAAIEGMFELKQMGNIITKAQQISDGWIQKADGGTHWLESGKVNKVDMLLDDLMQTEYKVVVWCAFKEDIQRLLEIAYKHSKHVATLQSKHPFEVDKWNDPDCRICLATEASGSSVNHFAQVPYAIYFSQDAKWHSLQQSSGRHTRRSSRHDTAYNIFLHSEKSLDAQVYYVVKQSQHSERSFIQRMGVKQWVEEK